jgi:hypothetical protein
MELISSQTSTCQIGKTYRATEKSEEGIRIGERLGTSMEAVAAVAAYFLSSRLKRRMSSI